MEWRPDLFIHVVSSNNTFQAKVLSLRIHDSVNTAMSKGVKDLNIFYKQALSAPVQLEHDKPFKAICRKPFSAFCRSQLSSMTNPADRLKTVSKQKVLQWMEEAQEYLSARPDMVIKAFQMTGISLAVDGTGNSLFRNDSCLKLPTDEETESEVEDEDDDLFKDLDDSELEDQV